MFSLIDKIKFFFKSLFPDGRAFRSKNGSDSDKLYTALNEDHEQTFKEAKSVLNSILPDNPNFTADDALRWEQRLGLITNTATPLHDRMQAIRRKMNYPGEIVDRSSSGFIQAQLQLAGFPVYVYENTSELTPNQVFGSMSSGIAQHATTGVYHMSSGLYHGAESLYPDMLANSIDESDDAYFDVGDNLQSTFFVCGSTLGAIVNISKSRKKEFRQLLLRLKPAHNIAYLGINWV